MDPAPRPLPAHPLPCRHVFGWGSNWHGALGVPVTVLGLHARGSTAVPVTVLGSGLLQDPPIAALPSGFHFFMIARALSLPEMMMMMIDR